MVGSHKVFTKLSELKEAEKAAEDKLELELENKNKNSEKKVKKERVV